MERLYGEVNQYISHELNNTITTILMKLSFLKTNINGSEGNNLEQDLVDIEKLLMAFSQNYQIYDEFSKDTGGLKPSWRSAFETALRIFENKIGRYNINEPNICDPLPKAGGDYWEVLMLAILILGHAIESSAPQTSIQIEPLDDLDGIKVRWASENEKVREKIEINHFELESSVGQIIVRQK